MTACEMGPIFSWAAETQLFENQRGDVDGAVGPAVDPPPLADVSHEPLGVFDDAIRMADRIAQRLGADNRLFALEQHDRRGGKLPLLIRKRDRLAAFVQMGDDRIRRSEVDSDGLCGNHMLSHANIDCIAERGVSEWGTFDEKPRVPSPFSTVGRGADPNVVFPSACSPAPCCCSPSAVF